MPNRRRTRRPPRRAQNESLVSRSTATLVRSALSSASNALTQAVTRVMNYSQALSSSAGGTINAILNFDPSAYTDWAAIGGAYDQFRMIGFRVRFFPTAAPTLLNQPVIAVYDNDDATTALGSLAAAADYRKKILFPSIWTNGTVKMITGEMYSHGNASTGVTWATTAAATTFPSSIKLYSTGLTASTQYFTVVCSLVVQFRAPV